MNAFTEWSWSKLRSTGCGRFVVVDLKMLAAA